MKKKHISLLPAMAISLALVACGGSETTQTSRNGNSGQIAHKVQGINLGRLSKKSAASIAVTTTNTTITFTYTDPAMLAGNKHFQFYLNTDNNVSTGFKFDNEAWNKSGADYLIEDDMLFKSKSNTTDWDWKYLGDINYTHTSDTYSATIDKSMLAGLGSKLRVGFLLRDGGWETEDFFPKSANMSSFTMATSTNDTTPPVLYLNGAAYIKIEQDSVFIDPGALAIDDVDGHITNSIYMGQPSTVDTSVLGITTLVYYAKDKAGNIGSISRQVEVVSGIAGTGIVVDGQKNDWHGITPVSESGQELYVTDDGQSLSLFITSNNNPANTQIFFDIDNNASTGLEITEGAWQSAGIDYMIENGRLFKKLPGNGWSWESAGDIEYFHQGDVTEISIPKGHLTGISSSVGIGFIKRDANWNVIPALLPATGLLNYTLGGGLPEVTADVRTALCANPTAFPVRETFTSNLGVGINLFGRLYKTTVNNGVYTLTATLANGTVETVAEHPAMPIIYSTKGAMYYVIPASRNPVRFITYYRVNFADGATAVKVRVGNKANSLYHMSYIQGNDYYHELYNRAGTGEGSLIRALHGAGDPQRVVLYTDYQNTSSERLQTYFKRSSNLQTGSMFYAYTRNNTRVLGVINGSTGKLQPITTCQ